MINRAILDAQRGQYVKGREQAVASVSAFNGAIECIDNLLKLLDEYEAAHQQQTTETSGAPETPHKET